MANIEKASLDGTNYDLGPDTIDASNITGTLPIANGGTGQTTKAAVRNALGLGNTTGALPIANGGTGQTNALNAVNALVAGVNVYSITDTTVSTGQVEKKWKVNGSGFVIVEVEMHSYATSDWGNHECWIYIGGVEKSQINMRTDVGYNGTQGASTCVFSKVTNGQEIRCVTRCSRSGNNNMTRYYNAAAFGCTLTQL